jgi:DNA-binding transcriptional LysR family regulator
MLRVDGARLPLIDLDLLQTVVAIADTGSFSSAAAVVFRTASAVSMQVRRIEEQLGAVLFHRDSRSVTVTPEGVKIVEHARRMIALNNEVVAHFVQPEVSGIVRIGAPEDVAELFLPDILRRMGATLPGIVIDVLVHTSDALRERFRDGRLDLGIVSRSEGTLDEPGSEMLYSERLVWAMGERGIAIERDPLPLALWEEGCTWRKACLDGLRAQGRRWRIAAMSAHITGQRAAVLADLAVTPLPVSALGGGVVEVPARHGLPTLPDDLLLLIVQKDAAAEVLAAADHVRRCFQRLQRAA